jgi:CheY-like chemotaxis protein
VRASQKFVSARQHNQTASQFRLDRPAGMAAPEPFISNVRFHGVSTSNQPTQPGPRTSETILIVLDDVLVRMVIADYLRQCGYRIIEAANADEALIVLQHKEATVDVVFTAIEMPGARDGFELSRWVRENRPDVEMVMAGSLARAASTAGDLCDRGPHKKRPYETTSIITQVNQLMSIARRQKERPSL